MLRWITKDQRETLFLASGWLGASQRGATSLVFAILIIPLLLVLMVIAIDIATYFSVREEVRALLDDEAHGALTRRQTSTQLQEAVTKKLKKLEGFVTKPVVRSVMNGDSSVLALNARYHGVLVDLCGDLFLRQMPEIPIDVEVQARKFSAHTLLVFDRTVSVPGAECTDSNFHKLKHFISTMVANLEVAGMRSIDVAFTPGVRAAIEKIGGEEEIKGCDSEQLVSYGQIDHLPGVYRQLPSALDLGAEIERLLMERQRRSPTERLGLVTVVRGERAGDGYIHSTIDLLDSMSQRNQLFLTMVHFGLDPIGDYRRPSYRPSFYGVRWREVRLESRQLDDPRLIAASLGHLGNDVHISR